MLLMKDEYLNPQHLNDGFEDAILTGNASFNLKMKNTQRPIFGAITAFEGKLIS